MGLAKVVVKIATSEELEHLLEEMGTEINELRRKYNRCRECSRVTDPCPTVSLKDMEEECKNCNGRLGGKGSR